MSWFDHWIEDSNEDIGPLSHWNEDSYELSSEELKEQEKICDECGAYYKNGCTYYVRKLGRLMDQLAEADENQTSELLRQRDELKEALKRIMFSSGTLKTVQDIAEAAIKNTDG